MRLRAAVFVNAVAAREAINLKQGPMLTQVNLERLQKAIFLLHSALNSFLLQQDSVHRSSSLWVVQCELRLGIRIDFSGKTSVEAEA